MKRLCLLALALVVLACSMPPLCPASPKCGPIYEIPEQPVMVCDAADGSKALYLAPWWPPKDELTETELKDFRHVLDIVAEQLAEARAAADEGDVRGAATLTYMAYGQLHHSATKILCERPK